MENNMLENIKNDNNLSIKNGDSLEKLDSPFENSDRTHAVIKEKQKVLTFLSTWRHRGLQAKQAEEQLAILTERVIQAQTKVLENQLRLGVDKTKKKDFNRYLADISSINKDIVVLSKDAAKVLLAESLDTDEEAFRIEKEQLSRFTNLHNEGHLTDEQLSDQIIKITSAYSGLRNYTTGMVEQIIEKSLRNFHHVLKIFDENKEEFK